MKLLSSQEQELVAIALFYADQAAGRERGDENQLPWEKAGPGYDAVRAYWRRRAVKNQLPLDEHLIRESISTYLDNIA